jgi:hypothetical protein
MDSLYTILENNWGKACKDVRKTITNRKSKRMKTINNFNGFFGYIMAR